MSTAIETKTDLSSAADGGSDVVVFYHGGCYDGFCAAWLLHRIYPDAEFIPAHPGWIPLTTQIEGKHVIIADLSLSPDTTRFAIEWSKSFLCLDHHRTAAERLAGLPGCHFEENKSGARMVWDWFESELVATFLSHERSPWKSVGAKRIFTAATHWLVDYTEDRDLWNWKLPSSRQVNAALRCFDLDFDTWDKLKLSLSVSYAIVISGDQEYDGDTIADYHTKKCSDAVKHAIEVEVPCEDESTIVLPAVNITNRDHTSDVGQLLAQSHESQIGLTYYHDGKGFRFSVRSFGDADAGRIAEFNGGGGHKHAAGFFRETFLPVFENENE